MEENVGTIKIGTKVDNSGLKKDLKETEKIAKDFDKNNEIDVKKNVKVELNEKEAKKTIKNINKDLDKLEDREVIIHWNSEEWDKYEPPKWAEVGGEPMSEEPTHLVPAGNEKTYKEWYKSTFQTVEEYEEAVQLAKEINEKTSEQLHKEAEKRAEYYKQLEIMEEQKALQKDMQRYEEAKQRLLEEYSAPESLEFDIGIDESQFDNTLLELKQKADVFSHDYEKALNKRNEIIESIALKEKELSVYEREHEAMLEDALEYQRLNELIAQGVELTEKEANKLNELGLRSRNLMAVAQEYNALINAQVRSQQSLQDNKFKLDELAIKYDKIVDKAKEYASVSKVSNINLSGLERGFSKLVKKASKLALALMGVRTILNVITRAFNTLSQYNTELADKINNIKLVLAVALEPIINWLVDAIVKLVGYINAFLKAFFGVDLYARASALSSQKIADNMGSAAGSAAEMKKQLAGFDEMNVLQDSQTSGGGGGGSTSNIPEFKLPEMELPAWMKWLDENKDKLPEMAGLVAGVVSPPVGGIILLTDGLNNLKKALEEYEEDGTFENFGEVVHRAGETVTGFGLIVGDAPIQIAGSFMAISGLLAQNKAEVDKWVNDITTNINDKATWLDENVSSTLGSMLENLGTDIQYVKDDFFLLMEEAQGDFNSISGIIKKFKEGDIKGAWNELQNWITRKWEKEKERFKNAIDNIKTKITNLFEGIKTDVENAKNWIIDKFNIVVNFFKNVGVAIGDFFSSAIKGAVNSMFNWVENKINSFIKAINKVIGKINEIPGVNLSKISTISLPRLATGGIINQPGRGVPVGGAIAGEAGREGILPLTDRQAMAELGREIGKWINIQATVPVNIGNRQVARVIQELNNDREFAMNS